MKEKKETKERKQNWREYTATVEDIERFLSDNVLLRHNVVAGRVEYRIPDAWPSESGGDRGLKEWLYNELFNCSDPLPPDSGGQVWLPISDRIVNTLWRALSKTKKVNAKDINQVIESDFSPDFNPFTFYLEHLPPWNGEDYILGMSVSVSIKGEVEEQMLFAQYLKKWLVGMVAGWVDPKAVNHEMLILIGEQGSYKTTWPPYVTSPPQVTEVKEMSLKTAVVTMGWTSGVRNVCCSPYMVSVP